MKRRPLSSAIVLTFGLGGACTPSQVASDRLSTRYPRTVNARHPQHGSIYRDADGSCFVELPFGEKPTSGGMEHPREPVECPPIMRHEAWQQCAGELILANQDGDDCVCDLRGNPPPPKVPRVPCPTD